jgi:rSAM/selenodomain-associated transferase 2
LAIRRISDQNHELPETQSTVRYDEPWLSARVRVTISVIIPTLNEAPCLPVTLSRLRQEASAEIVVSDGGSHDATLAIAQRFARVVQSPRGRAVQQNRGAAAASGEVLLFLHADCWLEPGWVPLVQRAARRPGFAAGCFRMRIEGDRRLYRLIEWGGGLRVRWLGLPYGDQGIFLRRDTFQMLGGFPAVPFMEDVMLMRRVRRLGRVDLVPYPIHVSPRRWERTGPIIQTLRNWTLTTVAVWGGVHPDRLTRFYPAVR